MNFSQLGKNITDVIKEQQVKLGYRSESVYLFYPLISLNRLLGTDAGPEQMEDLLVSFCMYAEPRLGGIGITRLEDRFCFVISPQGADWVHAHTDENEFIIAFVNTISRHCVTMDEVLELFHRYSDAVRVEKVDHPEYDYLVYFEKGDPDDYRYCLKSEGPHVTYHRYTPEDYQDFA